MLCLKLQGQKKYYKLFALRKILKYGASIVAYPQVAEITNIMFENRYKDKENYFLSGFAVKPELQTGSSCNKVSALRHTFAHILNKRRQCVGCNSGLEMYK